jgi:TonB family protein
MLEERIFRGAEKTISIGQSPKSTLVLPFEGVPRLFPLFRSGRKGWELCFDPRFSGRIGSSRAVETLTEVRERQAQRRGQRSLLPLGRSARGKIELGETAILFQVVALPPPPPRPRLPASVRGRLSDRVDGRLAALVAVSVAMHAAVAIYAVSRDRLQQARIDRVHAQFREDVYAQRVVARTIELPAPERAAAVVFPRPQRPELRATPLPQRIVREPGIREPLFRARDPREQEQGIEEVLHNQAIIKLATGDAAEHGRYQELRNQDAIGDLDRTIAHLRRSGNSVVAVSDGRPRARDQKTRTRLGDGERTGVETPARDVGTGEHEEALISRAKFQVDSLTSDSALDPAEVARTIRARYLSGIKLCHQRVLKVEPTAGGRVTIRFTVAASGRVTETSVRGFDGRVDDCIRALALRWRFAAPRKSDGAPTQAEFQVPVILKPGNE